MIVTLSYDQSIAAHVLIDYVPSLACALGAAADVQALTLANRAVHQARVLTYHLAFSGNNRAWR